MRTILLLLPSENIVVTILCNGVYINLSQIYDPILGKLIPKYEDLKMLFQEVHGKAYTEEEYNEQFKIRVDALLAKINRIVEIYKAVPDAPDVIFKVLNEEISRLNEAKSSFGEIILPVNFS